MFIIIKFNNKFKSLFLYWLWESLIGLPNLADIPLGGHFMSIIHASRLPKISLYALPLIRASSYPWLFCQKSWIDKISGIDFVMKLYQYTYSLWWALLACLQNLLLEEMQPNRRQKLQPWQHRCKGHQENDMAEKVVLAVEQLDSWPHSQHSYMLAETKNDITFISISF